jgi:hypothetical protein
MVWWIVAAAVVIPLLGLAAVLAGLRRRLVELARVAALGQERVAQLQPRLTASAARLQTTLADLQRQLASLPVGRTSD